MKRRYLFVPVVLALLIGLPVLAKGNTNTLVPAGQTITGNFYAAGGTVEVNGDVTSDVIVAGGNVIIAGKVGGDVLVVGGNVKVTGVVSGNVRAFGGNVEISGSVARNVSVAAGTLILADKSEVAGYVTAGAGNLDLRGVVKGGVLAGSGNVILTGEVQGPVELWLDKEGSLEVRDTAKTGGPFTYHAAKPGSISSSAKLQQAPAFVELPKAAQRQSAVGWGWLISLFGALVLGMVAIHLMPKKLEQLASTMLANPWASLGWGLVWGVVAPVAALLLLITIIGAPITLLIVLAYIAGFVVVPVVVGTAIGSWLKQRFESSWLGKTSGLMVLLIGILAYKILGAIPFLGIVVVLLATLWAWGALLQSMRASIVKQ